VELVRSSDVDPDRRQISGVRGSLLRDILGRMPSKKTKVKQVLYLRLEQVQKLKKLAKQRDVPMSQLLRDAVDEFLKK